MAYKATYKGCINDRYDKRYTELVYEYRGHEYIVTKPNSWTGCSSDYYYGDMRLTEQHRRAQEGIDAKIDHPYQKPYQKPSEEEIAEAQKKLDDAMELFYSSVGL